MLVRVSALAVMLFLGIFLPAAEGASPKEDEVVFWRVSIGDGFATSSATAGERVAAMHVSIRGGIICQVSDLPDWTFEVKNTGDTATFDGGAVHGTGYLEKQWQSGIFVVKSEHGRKRPPKVDVSIDVYVSSQKDDFLERHFRGRQVLLSLAEGPKPIASLHSSRRENLFTFWSVSLCKGAMKEADRVTSFSLRVGAEGLPNIPKWWSMTADKDTGGSEYISAHAARKEAGLPPDWFADFAVLTEYPPTRHPVSLTLVVEMRDGRHIIIDKKDQFAFRKLVAPQENGK